MSCEEKDKNHYDFVVIGGGSGGLACAKEAAKYGAKVALFDYVEKSPQGTTWGLGGTCVNVGCIPKKLFHYAGLLGRSTEDAKELGWNFGDKSHKWNDIVDNVGNYIRSLNWNYRVALNQNNVHYLNAYAQFKDEHTIEYKRKAKKRQKTPIISEFLTFDKVLIATGGRPNYPNIPGVELGISSDDLFSWYKEPGRTLVVGASYIALECAGFLHEMGYEVNVLVRSILLRGFDRHCADLIGETMQAEGIKFIQPAIPEKLEEIENEKIRVTYKRTDTNEIVQEIYDTVLWAVGRSPCTNKIGIENTNIQLSEHSKKVITNDNDQTNISHIYAIGDVAEGRPELTPSAIKAGVLLAKRLYGKSNRLMDYHNVPTTVFTPVEYGAIGYTIEDAQKALGNDNIEVYISRFGIVETAGTHRKSSTGEDLSQQNMAILICDKKQNERVVGFHYVGPNAGEVTQGFAVAMKAGATKEHFDDTVGIHPTSAEEFTTLEVTLASGLPFKKTGGC